MNKNVIAMGFVSFFTDMASAMITPLIPILVVYVLHENMQRLGEIVAIATFISYSFRVLFGYLGDKYNLVKPFVVSGYLISALTKPFFYFANSWQVVAFLQSTERMGKAIRSASKDSLISAYAKPRQSGKTFGFHKMMDIAGELCGAVIVFCILYFIGQGEALIKNIFALTAIPGLIAVIIVVFMVKDITTSNKSSDYQWQTSDTKLLPLLFFYFAFLVFIFSSSFLVIKAGNLGYQIAIIPLFFIVLNLTQTLSSYHIGLRIDKIGSVNMLLISFAFGVLTQLCLYFNAIWLAFIFLGFFTVSSLNAIRSYISHHAKNKSTVFGVFYAGTAIFSALGAWLTGYLWNHWSEAVAIMTSVTGTLVLTAVFVFSKNRYQDMNTIK